jgi:hypothetical protein
MSIELRIAGEASIRDETDRRIMDMIRNLESGLLARLSLIETALAALVARVVVIETTFIKGVGAFSSTPNSKGLSVVSQEIVLSTGDATRPGGLSVGAQNISGAKRFNDTIELTTVKLLSNLSLLLSDIKTDATGLVAFNTAYTDITETDNCAFDAFSDGLAVTTIVPHTVNSGGGLVQVNEFKLGGGLNNARFRYLHTQGISVTLASGSNSFLITGFNSSLTTGWPASIRYDIINENTEEWFSAGQDSMIAILSSNQILIRVTTSATVPAGDWFFPTMNFFDGDSDG